MRKCASAVVGYFPAALATKASLAGLTTADTRSATRDARTSLEVVSSVLDAASRTWDRARQHGTRTKGRQRVKRKESGAVKVGEGTIVVANCPKRQYSGPASAFGRPHLHPSPRYK